MSISAMKQAIQALEFYCEYGVIDRPFERIAELKQAIAKAEKREWVGLTQKEFLQATQIAARGNCCLAITYAQQTLKEKNCATAPVSE